ncbi:helix-turn-helix domain-containing protein [Mogibacterium timidum]|uniref:helix-turn-helix domain-containing protein n=1 Tax=Mogibacterium timidum TaxID=35519 RepID=UPI0028DB6591|nr:S24 family peptidase [Mogibacterium timidum]
MATLGDIIKSYRKKNHLSMDAFSKRSGISKAYISFLEKNAHPGTNKPIAPSIETIKQASDGMNMDFNTLFGMIEGNVSLDTRFSERPLPSNIVVPAGRQLPILGTICAGDGIHCEENFEGYFFVDKSIKADYCLRVKGDSMIDANIYDGDVAFLRKDFDFIDGEIYAVCYGAEESASLKKLYKADDKIMLQPCNSDYAAAFVNVDDVVIVGECIGTYHAR